VLPQYSFHTNLSKEVFAENLVKIASELSVLEPNFQPFIGSGQGRKTIVLFFFARKLLKTRLGGFLVGFWC
jgi:hypothetical protein